jgi:hypothetical protein
MGYVTRRSFVALASFSLLLAVAGSALGSTMREFSGEVQRSTKDYIIVDNRMGDKIKFEFSKDRTVVEGEETEWKKIKRKAWVTVSSKMLEKRRIAYKVVVEPAREEE